MCKKEKISFFALIRENLLKPSIQAIVAVIVTIFATTYFSTDTNTKKTEAKKIEEVYIIKKELIKLDDLIRDRVTKLTLFDSNLKRLKVLLNQEEKNEKEIIKFLETIKTNSYKALETVNNIEDTFISLEEKTKIYDVSFKENLNNEVNSLKKQHLMIQEGLEKSLLPLAINYTSKLLELNSENKILNNENKFIAMFNNEHNNMAKGIDKAVLKLSRLSKNIAKMESDIN